MKTLLTAAWVAPMTGGGAVRGGGVVHADGKIVAVGPAKSLETSHPDAVVEHLGDVILLPGLVNAHCHLELTFAARPPRPIRFAAWALQIVEQMRRDARVDQRSDDLRAAMAQCLALGVTCVGDITANPREVRAVVELERRRPRIVSYGEVRAMASRRGLLHERLTAATEPTLSPLTRIGVSPHAPYSIEADGFRECLAAARRAKLPLTTHLAETPDEEDFLAAHRGPLRDLWDAIGGWDDAVPRFEGGPIRYARAIGLLDHEPTSLAHVNYCDDEELSILAAGRASVVYCPRTHDYFGHSPHRWREMLTRQINVAVGTDSSASSPDLNLVDDLRLLRRLAPEVPVEILWEMATVRGARAVGMERELGTLEPGKHADLVAFSIEGSDSDPLANILDDSARRPATTWIGGTRVAGTSS